MIYSFTQARVKNLKKNDLIQLLIPIFATYFVQAQFKQARLSCELNSCIILYFILLSIGQVHATYGEIEEVLFGGYGSVPFEPFT